VSTVTKALEAAYDVSGIYEDFTLFFDAALQIADRFGDVDLFDRLRQVVDNDGSTPPAGLAGHRALVDALTSSDDDVAEAGFRSALGHYGAWGSTVHVARTQAAYGAWLTRHGRIAEAEPLLAEARATYAALGAVAWLEDLERALVQHRVGS
jgi:hypothetical protein